jgi:plasmid stabilization system protein ParE
MIYQIYISEAAEFDIKESYFWYENQQPKLGEFFKIQVMQLVETIKLNPLLFQIKHTIVRVAFLHKFPFGIHYVIKGESIIILAVFHTSLDPSKWLKR